MTNQQRMEDLTRNLVTKSDKIRTLGSAGYSRRQIADFLGIRYQHVRNVLIDEERRQRGPGLREAAERWDTGQPSMPLGQQGRLRVGSDGSVAIPSQAIESANFTPGEALVVQVAGDGEVRVLSGRAAIRYAQALVREIVPDSVSLVDELLRERRREAEHE
jgi:antitoxin component of MazEF toxin-antitoxin module